MKKSFDQYPGGEDLQIEGATVHHGSLDAGGLRFGIAVSRFNLDFTHAQAEAAVTCLRELGADEADIELTWVPGAYEIPLILEEWAQSGRFSALIGLGTVIQGATPHAKLITESAAIALSEIGRKHRIPVIDGIIAALNVEQAEERALGGRKSRGWYAAEAAVETARSLESCRRKRP